ncbi:MAG: FlgD immunoglobulin-like domain containing protein [Patescibacteria group bacterium]
MVKNKKLFTYLGILLAVVVVGAAVYFGNAKMQRGAFPGLPKIPVQLPAQNPQGDIQRATPPVMNYSVFPSTINPYAGQAATITYQVTRRLNGLSLSIYDRSSSLVSPLVVANTPVEPGTYHIIWNGRYNSGNIVAPGAYTYRLTLGGINVGSGNITVSAP